MLSNNVVKLGNISSIVMGQSPSGETYNSEGIGSPLLNGPTEFGSAHPKAVQWTTKPIKFCEMGDVLVCVRGSSTGRMNIADQNYCIGRGLAAIRANSEVADQGYIRFHIERLASSILKQATGSTFPNIDKKRLADLSVFCPPLPEQRKVAVILTSVDDAIDATQRIIDQTEVVKRGLMQELLTKGIGHTTFKQTEIGEIPAEWDVAALGTLGTFSNGLNKGKNDFGKGTLFVNVADIASCDKIDFEQLNRVNLTDTEVQRYKLQPNDIVLVRSYGNPEKLGYPALFAGYTEHVVHSGFTIRFRPHLEELDPNFLLYVLKHDRVRAEMLQKSTISANNNINQQALSSIGIPLPSLNEQKHIANVLLSVDAKTSSEKEVLNRLSALKTALSQVLLTGKVRVNVDEPSEVSV